MVKVDFEGVFKGDRDYLQGGDLFDRAQSIVLSELGQDAYIKSISFRHLARESGTFFIDCDSVPKDYVLTAMFKIQNGSQIINGVFGTNGGEVSKKVEFDESLILAHTEINEVNMSISQVAKTNFTSCEEIVSLTKALHYKVLPLDEGKWIFTMLNMRGLFLLQNKNLFTVKIRQNLGGKMTRSDLIIKNQVVGNIGFTVL